MGCFGKKKCQLGTVCLPTFVFTAEFQGGLNQVTLRLRDFPFFLWGRGPKEDEKIPNYDCNHFFLKPLDMVGQLYLCWHLDIVS